jgi:hypothetical protein
MSGFWPEATPCTPYVSCAAHMKATCADADARKEKKKSGAHPPSGAEQS